MAHLRKDNSANQKGKINYNAGIVSGIVSLAINEVEGVELLNNKSKGVKLVFEKDEIIADISVKVTYGYNVTQLAFKIQQSIKHNVESMTKYKVSKVDVHIQDVNFPDTVVV